MEVIEPYVFGDATLSGAVFVLAEAGPCDVEFTVVLDADESGAVTSERTYHDVAAIEACGWQR
ncbi:MAG TPA: hypothetical protein VLS28_06650 [Candidatus Sulfomarinibacteraceae bacterium]|nr:hypothetical protein [Candidatus Sulfomarinibacteraceae bacterium]